MFVKAFTLVVAASTAAAAQFYQPVHHDFGSMLKRGATIAKRQGYYPTTEPCGQGDTCEEACGAGKEQCPSSGGLYCYDPKLGKCCPDDSGYACDTGYYCTTDGLSNTYCCLDGLELGACAEAYALTVSLIRETGSVLVPPSPTTHLGTPTAYAPVSTTPIHISHPTGTAPVKPTTNGTYTTATPPEFTGAAAKGAGAAMAVLGGAAVFAGLL